MALPIKLNKEDLKNPHTAVSAALCVISVFILVIALIVNIGNDDGKRRTQLVRNVTYPSLFYHYTGFNQSPQGSIKLGWRRTKLRLNADNAQIQMFLQYFPLTLKDRRVEYTTSDESIATVDENGLITAYRPGNVRITARLVSSGYTESALLEVIKPVSGIMMTKTSITMNKNDAWQSLDATVYPHDATIKDIIWESSDTKVAVIDENGTLKPLGNGMSVITARSKDGGFTATAFVNVVDKVIPVEAVSIQNKGSGIMAVGESMNMIPSVYPSNAKKKEVSWSSTDPNVAQISKTGKIKALAEGVTTIILKSSNGKTDMMELRVDASTGAHALDLTDKITSNHEMPTDILGSTYLNAGVSVVDDGVAYTSYDIALHEIVDLQMSLSPPPKIWRDGGLVGASREETEEYMDPASYYAGAYKYQFLDLSSSNGVSAEELDKFLEGRGILEGQGQAFVDAAAANNISEVYLVAHACLETGNGSTTLANGIEVNGTMVYNMFGIGAYDDSAEYSGSQRAYANGWTSPEAAIKGGAEWISKWYINAEASRQNTLYKMLWNPETPGEHQYATDIGWAVKQAISIEKIFQSFPDAQLSFDVPVYMGQIAINLE